MQRKSALLGHLRGVPSSLGNRERYDPGKLQAYRPRRWWPMDHWQQPSSLGPSGRGTRPILEVPRAAPPSSGVHRLRSPTSSPTQFRSEPHEKKKWQPMSAYGANHPQNVLCVNLLGLLRSRRRCANATAWSINPLPHELFSVEVTFSLYMN